MGVDFPSPIQTYIDAKVIGKRCPAYLQVNTEGGLSDWGGALHHYGIEGLQPGQDAAEQLPFLIGLLPMDEHDLVLPWMETLSGCYADVHLLGFEPGTWIVLLDATEEATQYGMMQQKINDINLHLEASERTLEARLQQIQNVADLATSAGGFVHDLSHVLATILGYTEQTLYGTSPDDVLRQNLHHLQTASQQASDLVQSALALNQQPLPPSN